MEKDRGITITNVDKKKQCDIPVVAQKGTFCDVCGSENTITVSHKGENCDYCNPL